MSNMAKASSSGSISDEELTTSSSDDNWTIVHDRRDKIQNLSEMEIEDENDTNEKDSNEDDLDNVACSATEEKEEESDEFAESDSISVLRDEEDEIERMMQIEWNYAEESFENDRSLAMVSRTRSLGLYGSSNTIIICSMMALILGLITGQMLEFRSDKENPVVNADLQDKLQQLSGIEDKLKELNDVKKALDQIRHNMTQELRWKRSAQNIEKFKTGGKKHRKNVKLRKIDDRLEKLQNIYSNIYSVISAIHTDNDTSFNDSTHEVPRIIFDMMTLKKSMKRASDNLQSEFPVKRKLQKMETIVDAVTESLLRDYSEMFTRFSSKIRDSLSRISDKLLDQLCQSNRSDSEGIFYQLMKEPIFLNKNCQELGERKRKIKIKQNGYNESEVYEMKRQKIFRVKRPTKPYLPNFSRDYYQVQEMNQWNPRLSDLKVEENVSDSRPGKAKGEKGCQQCRPESEEKSRPVIEQKSHEKKEDKKRKKKSDKSLKKMDRREIIANDFEKFVIVEDGKFPKPGYPAKSNSDKKMDLKREKHDGNDGDWQIQRSEGREKLRNLNDWYFVRANSRQTARTQFFDENSYRF